jgi:hypothetical protein
MDRRYIGYMEVLMKNEFAKLASVLHDIEISKNTTEAAQAVARRALDAVHDQLFEGARITRESLFVLINASEEIPEHGDDLPLWLDKQLTEAYQAAMHVYIREA